jgi:hypothetical protein
MKKILGIFVIAASLVACNNSSDGTTTNDTVNTVDTVTPTITTPDTSGLVGDTTKKDTTNR